MRKEIIAKLDALDRASYGGFFGDRDQKTIHVNLVIGKTNKTNIDFGDGVIVHYVKYSLDELESLHSNLIPHMSDYQIQHMYVDIKRNKLYIGVYQPLQKSLEAIRRFVGKEDYIDIVEENTQFTDLELKYDSVFSNPELQVPFVQAPAIVMHPGSKIITVGADGVRYVGSIALNAVWATGSENKYGFLTHGHGNASTGDPVYYDNQCIGHLVRRDRTETLDSGLIERDASNIYIQQPALNGITSTYVGGNPPVDDPVYFSGAISPSLIGTCQSVNASVTISGINKVGLIQTDCAAQPGDSGGPLYFYWEGVNEFSFCATATAGDQVSISFFTKYFTTKDYYRSIYNNFYVN